VGIVVFGLVPTFTGKGYGAEFLIRATELAWQLRTDKPTRRVWLQTSSLDHPHALSNYERRGFRRFASTIVDGGSERVHDRQIGRGGDAWQP
jgi:GNAT superfamily N-acetyltransferase